ncbi:PKD domain-containing protein [Hymenobacter sp. H14-R3]|uniref:PKD domain-containing protein n=1 Tax=Hymenobacter sp. H14-R3 TaxID=3046308 RepID=UPI0024BA56F3|nr:PKD domain-containing protein [Hymenobacter sp. H14-R3]MDJ0364655.1 PKD domain-containing protein [Hymenobacter sp. H14-R3]
MSTYFRHAALLLAGAAALAACRKDTGATSLEGIIPTPAFTVTLNTSQYPVTATFTNTTTDAFLYQWDFGDGSPLASGQNVTHTYKLPDTYRVRLTAAGRGGSSVSPQLPVTIPTICGNAGYAVLTACGGSGATSWTLSDQPGAVVKLSASGAVLSTSPVLNACQLDDVFSFTSNFSYAYDAGAGTFANGTCGTARTGNSDFVYRPSGTLGQLVLQRNKSFIGLPDSVVNKTYDLVEATATRLRLQGTNPDGTKTVTTYIPQLSALDRAKQLLTGGGARTWLIDNSVADAIIVGNEANISSYNKSGSAGSVPACQADDEYTFSTAGNFTYNANGQTFVAIDYTCQAARANNTTFTFGPASGAGVAQFVLAAPGSFIGVTNAATSRIYRIISIDDKHMTLRAGGPTDDPLFEFKMVAK